MHSYKLTSTQVDLIVWALQCAPEMTTTEEDERSKIYYALDRANELPPAYCADDDPYAGYCDI